jgi:hypothetical protein
MRRILNAVSTFSPIDREAHARRILAVLRSKRDPAPPPLDESLLDRARESSRPVPEREESP